MARARTSTEIDNRSGSSAAWYRPSIIAKWGAGHETSILSWWNPDEDASGNLAKLLGGEIHGLRGLLLRLGLRFGLRFFVLLVSHDRLLIDPMCCFTRSVIRTNFAQSYTGVREFSKLFFLYFCTHKAHAGRRLAVPAKAGLGVAAEVEDGICDSEHAHGRLSNGS